MDNLWMIYGLFMDNLWIWLIYPLVMTNIAIEHHNFYWENSQFQWPFSIAMLNYQRVWILPE